MLELLFTPEPDGSPNSFTRVIGGAERAIRAACRRPTNNHLRSSQTANLTSSKLGGLYISVGVPYHEGPENSPPSLEHSHARYRQRLSRNNQHRDPQWYTSVQHR